MANFMESLRVMLYGMLGIFVVIASIYLVIVILNAVTRKKKKEQE